LYSYWAPSVQNSRAEALHQPALQETTIENCVSEQPVTERCKSIATKKSYLLLVKSEVWPKWIKIMQLLGWGGVKYGRPL
jgi:hypothetical protein